MDAHEEFLRLFLQHQADVKAFIGSLIPDRHVRADVFQETALELWRQLARYDRRRSFGAWARGVAANKILQHKARNARFPVAFSPDTIRALLDAFERTEPDAPRKAAALRTCVQALPAHARQLLDQRYERGHSVAEIAQQNGRTLDAVYQALSRVRARLEECIRRQLALDGGGA